MPKIALPVALTARYNAELYYLWFLIFALYERKNERREIGHATAGYKSG